MVILSRYQIDLLQDQLVVGSNLYLSIPSDWEVNRHGTTFISITLQGLRVNFCQ